MGDADRSGEQSRARVTAELSEVAGGIRRVTFNLPLAIEHVHCYFVRGESGAWMLVDTAIAYPGVAPHWQAALDALDGPVEKILVTHFHPDHVGGARLVAELTGAPVYQGRLDFENCVKAWSTELWEEELRALLARHGFPEELGDRARKARSGLVAHIQYSPDPVLVDPGEEIDGWQILHLPGHAPGHLAFLRGGVLVCGDVLLERITPSIPLDLVSGPDPLGAYLESLERVADLAPSVALAGHNGSIDDPAGRAGEITVHHEERLACVVGVVAGETRPAYEVSVGVFPDDLPPILRLFAFFETLSHLEYLVLRERLERVQAADGALAYRYPF